MTTNRQPFLVTGATDGIGFETAVGIVRAGKSLVLHGRTLDKAKAAASEVLRRFPGAQVRTVFADFTNLEEVRRLGHHLQFEGEPLAGVVHNAGALFKERTTTVDGWEATWQVNHLAPFLLHQFLAPLLAAGNHARVVWVSSKLHHQGVIPWDDFKQEHSWDSLKTYNATKLANAMVAFRIARTHSPSYLASFAVHPGVVGTKMLREGFGRDGIGAEEGAWTSLYAALDPSLDRKTGKYLENRLEAPASADARNEDLQDRLWEWTTGALGL